MYAIGDGTEVLAVEGAFENALDFALNRTSGKVEHLGKTWDGRGEETDDTLFIYEFDPAEQDDEGVYVFAAERSLM